MLDFKPFRFWCQKMLPAVYDDSLSYYELLCKVVAYLNDMASQTETQFNSLEKNVNTLSTSFTELKEYVKNYFNNLDIQNEIDKKIDDLILNGSLVEMFKNVLGFVMVEWYGGEGDGVTDCTQAFNNAINTELPIILLPNKHYIVKSNLTINDINGNNSTLEFDIAYNDNPVNEKAQAISIKHSINNITLLSPNGFISVYSTSYADIKNVKCVTNRKQTSITSKNGSIIQLNNSNNININNVSFDTSYIVNDGTTTNIYYFNDGIHINGGCHDINISDVTGVCLDDFIAFNTVEGIGVTNKDIYNVNINNCTSNKSFGLRFYGFDDTEIFNIYNICVNNCIINTNSNVPAIRFLNSVGLGGQSKTRINCYNVIIKNSIFSSDIYTVYFTRCMGDVSFDNCVFNNTKTHTFYSENSVGGDSQMNLNIISCTFNSGNFQPLRLLGWTANNENAYSYVNIINSKFTSTGVFLVTSALQKIVIKNCIINCNSLLGGSSNSYHLIMKDCDCKNTNINLSDMFETYYFDNNILSGYDTNEWMIYVNPNNTKTVLIMGNIFANNGLTSITPSSSVKYRLKGNIQQNNEPPVHNVGDYYIDTLNKVIKIY